MSFRPRPIVLAAMRVTRDTAAMPPYPAALASAAAKSRRCRSSRCGKIAALRFWRESSLIIPKTTTRHTGTESPSHAVKPDPIDNPIQLLSDGPLVLKKCPLRVDAVEKRFWRVFQAILIQ